MANRHTPFPHLTQVHRCAKFGGLNELRKAIQEHKLTLLLCQIPMIVCYTATMPWTIFLTRNAKQTSSTWIKTIQIMATQICVKR